MAEYIPPHERKADYNEDPDKSISNLLNEVFEPRGIDNQMNITVRKSSIHSKLEELNGKVNKQVTNGNSKDGAPVTGSDDTAEVSQDDPPINPRLLAILSSIEGKVTEQGATLTRIDLSQTQIQKSVDYAHANVSDLKDRVVKLEKENCKLQDKNEILESQNRDMNRRIGNIEQQMALIDHGNKRRNILIDGVPESANENTTDIAVDILSMVDKDVKSHSIEYSQRVHRPGAKVKQILVVMKSLTQRDNLMKNKRSLKTQQNMSNIWLNDDPNNLIRKQKLENRSIVKCAVSQGYEAKQKGHGMVINGRYFSRDNLDQLPEKIKLHNTRTKMTENAVGFQGKLSPLSNMHKCTIVMDGIKHKSAEHTIQYKKVMLEDLKDLAQKIWDTDCPYTAKIMGDAVTIPIWNDVGVDTVADVMREKYKQNPHLKKILLDTGTRTIVECTQDRKWGAGISLESKLLETGKWPGQNITGYKMQEIRVELRDQDMENSDHIHQIHSGHKVTPPPQQDIHTGRAVAPTPVSPAAAAPVTTATTTTTTAPTATPTSPALPNTQTLPPTSIES